VWRYQAQNPKDFYSSEISGAHRLPNGNTLICAGVRGVFFEVTPAGETVWNMSIPWSTTGSWPKASARAWTIGDTIGTRCSRSTVTKLTIPVCRRDLTPLGRSNSPRRLPARQALPSRHPRGTGRQEGRGGQRPDDRRHKAKSGAEAPAIDRRQAKTMAAIGNHEKSTLYSYPGSAWLIRDLDLGNSEGLP